MYHIIVNGFLGANFPFFFLPKSYDKKKKDIKHDRSQQIKSSPKYIKWRKGDQVHRCIIFAPNKRLKGEGRFYAALYARSGSDMHAPSNHLELVE